MPTRKDNTNVAPIYREQVIFPAKGTTLMRQKAKPKINGIPVASGAIEIVSPEFDLLTGARGLLNMIKPNKVYANVGNGSNMTMFDGATTTNEAVKQGIKEARDYVRHPVIVETVDHNKRLSERLFGKTSRNNRAEVLQHYADKPVHIQSSNDLPKGFLGDYSRANTRIRFKQGMNPYDTKRTVFHEGLHHSGYGNFEGTLYDLKAEKLFNIDDYLMGDEAAVNTAELGRMMGLKLGQKYPGFQTFKDMIAKYNVDGFDKKFIFDKAILNTPRDYKRFWDAITGKYFTTAGTIATGLSLTNVDEMKCGGRRKAQLGLDIREGGIAIPIAPNMYYMNGRSHDEGGIGIGPNNKNGLEVEGGEIVKVGKNDVKVFSSVPLLRGVSPAQLVMGGANPDIVFKAQEEFKDRNRINDDGTRYQIGGQKKPNSAIRTDADKNVSAFNRAVYSLVDPTMGYPTKGQAVGFGIGAGFKAMRNPNDMVYAVEDSVSDAGWRKRLGLSYDEKFLPANSDGSVRLPRNREMEIPTDTTMLKRRIAANEKLAKRYPEHLQSGKVNEKREIVDWALKVDKMALDNLRHTYKTGEPVVLNEGAYNSRSLIKDGQLSYPDVMPMNVLQNYTVQYNPKTRQLEYRDVYDFNEFEWGVPGKPFNIKGSVPVKKFGGNMIYEINGNVKNTLGSYRPKAEWGKKRKVDTYGNFITVDDENYFFDKNGVFVPVEETIIKKQPKTVRGASTRRDIAYDRQGNRYQRRSDGSLIRVSPEKGNIAVTNNLPELVVTATKSTKNNTKAKPNASINISLSKKTENYLTGQRRSANRHPIPEFVGKSPITNNEKESVKVNTNSTPRRGNTQAKSVPVVDNGPKVTRSPHYYVNYRGIGTKAASPYNKAGVLKSIAGDSTYDVSQLGSPATKQAKAKLNTSSTGGGTQSNTNERWVGQYKPVTTADWIGLGSNLAGSIASYFITKNLLDKYPMPQKPIMAPAAKLKTRYNERPEITTIDDAQQMMDANISRNTQSSSTSLARRQRNLNQGIAAKNQVYGKKENIETQLINQDRLNRQTVVGRNVAAFNDWLNKTYVAKAQKVNDEISLKNNLLTGMVGSVTNLMDRIYNRKAINNTIGAMVAANPNTDSRQTPIFDYYNVYDNYGKFLRKEKRVR